MLFHILASVRVYMYYITGLLSVDFFPIHIFFLVLYQFAVSCPVGQRLEVAACCSLRTLYAFATEIFFFGMRSAISMNINLCVVPDRVSD